MDTSIAKLSQSDIETFLGIYYNIFNNDDEYYNSLKIQVIVECMLYKYDSLLKDQNTELNSYKLLVLNVLEYLMEKDKFNLIHEYCIKKYKEILNKEEIVQIPKFDLSVNEDQMLIPRKTENTYMFKYLSNILDDINDHINQCLNTIEETYKLILDNNLNTDVINNLNKIILTASTIIINQTEFCGNEFEQFLDSEIDYNHDFEILLNNLAKFSTTLTTIHMCLQNTDEVQLCALKILAICYQFRLKILIEKNNTFDYELHKQILICNFIVQFFKRYITNYERISNIFIKYYVNYYKHIADLYYQESLTNISNEMYKKHLALCSYDNYLRANLMCTEIIKPEIKKAIDSKIAKLKNKYNFETFLSIHSLCYYINPNKMLTIKQQYKIDKMDDLLNIFIEIQNYEKNQTQNYMIESKNMMLYMDKNIKSIINQNHNEKNKFSYNMNLGIYGLITGNFFYSNKEIEFTESNNWTNFVISYVNFVRNLLHFYEHYVNMSKHIDDPLQNEFINENIIKYKTYLDSVVYEYYNSDLFKNNTPKKLLSNDIIAIVGLFYNTYALTKDEKYKNLFKTFTKEIYLYKIKKVVNSNEDLTQTTLSQCETALVNLVNVLDYKISDWKDIYDKFKEKVIEYYKNRLDQFYEIYVDSNSTNIKRKNISIRFYNVCSKLKQLTEIEEKYENLYNEILSNGSMKRLNI